MDAFLDKIMLRKFTVELNKYIYSSFIEPRFKNEVQKSCFKNMKTLVGSQAAGDRQPPWASMSNT